MVIVIISFNIDEKLIEKKITKKNAIELLIETDAGKLISIIQETSSYNFSKNQKVRIIKRNGKSRVVPFD